MKTFDDTRLVALGLLLFICTLVAYPTAYYSSSEIVHIKVTNKERIVTSESSKYLIFTEDAVYQNTDDLLYLKFNSSDVYGYLEPGMRYSVKVAGWRVPFLSMYPNIIEVRN